ncbi:MFS transporter [Streptomyces sp. SL13]|uniref:MFS transporter n=1 Tax=Streptantibioticus silvisoli TaxID=2705255 RepID=A0AA90KAI6_9ACTN|nr:MFS transporter [Streptantibioticus silvisoli]MDI5972463.1 MFS transporter [Streptantibioticus silvisoli]
MDRTLRAGRAATFAFFALNGFVLGMWVVHIPAVEGRTGISHAVLGWLLLLLGGGAYAGMRVAGPLADRFGARRLVPAGAVLTSAAVVLPGLARGPWTLAGGLLVLGLGNGCLDVSMNAHAVQVERGYDRPVMSAFHAVFSIGGVAASLIGAWALGRGWSAPATLAGVGALGLVATALATRGLLRPAGRGPGAGSAGGGPADGIGGEVAAGGVGVGDAGPAVGTGAGTGAVDGAAVGRPVGDTVGDAAGDVTGAGAVRPAASGRVWALATLALMLMLSEGVANDWSVLDLRDVLHAPAGTAALAFGAFATAMTAGRLVADRVSGRFGPVAVVRYGSWLAAAGLAAVTLTPWVPVALVGWTVFGAGLSGSVPQLFSAAGRVDPAAAGANVSRVAGLGYLGMLAGPAIIGPLTHFLPLQHTFFLPVALCVAAGCTAPVLRARTGTPHPAGREPLPAADRTAG